MNTEKATITTIAEATGLSLATVSRALAGSARVLPETRAKVLAAAQAMNYVKDRTAVRLKTGKTHVVAFIMDRFDATQPGFKELLLGLTDSIKETDYHLVVLPDSTDADPLATVRYVVERGLADGLVLTHTTPYDERVRYLQERSFPFITHGRTAFKPAHASVDFANETFAEMGVETLSRHGRKNLAILLPHEGGVFRSHLIQGFETGCARFDVQGKAITTIDLDASPDLIYRWAVQHAAEYDGLIVTREAPMLPLLSGLADTGLLVGQHIDVVAKYSSSLPQYIRQPLWVCYEDLHLAGMTLGQQMLAHFSQPDQALAQVLFSPPAIEHIHEQTRS